MRLATILVVLLLVASACSPSSDDDSSAGSIPASSTPEVSSSRGGAPTLDPSFDYGQVDYEAQPVGSALRGDRDDAAFPPSLVDPNDIARGGPPPDGIPPIDEPKFVPVAEVDFIDSDTEAVVVVEVNGDARAYPVQILIWHEIVNDEIGGEPVTVTYCPLCNSAVVYQRQIGNRILDFGTSGELYQSALVMYDRQTESLWAHFTGQAIVGHYAGTQLQLVPAQTLGFGSFKEAFPDGLVLSPDTGFDRPYGTNPYVGYDDAQTNPIGGFISQPIDDRFSAKTRLVGVTDDEGAYSILLDSLAEARVIAVTEGGRNDVVFYTDGLNSSLENEQIDEGRDVGQTGVFVAQTSDGTALTFESSDDHFVDNETGSTWDILGRAIDGELAGERLAGVPHVDSFWFSWSTYQPDQVLIER